MTSCIGPTRVCPACSSMHSHALKMYVYTRVCTHTLVTSTRTHTGSVSSTQVAAAHSQVLRAPTPSLASWCVTHTWITDIPEAKRNKQRRLQGEGERLELCPKIQNRLASSPNDHTEQTLLHGQVALARSWALGPNADEDSTREAGYLNC